MVNIEIIRYEQATWAPPLPGARWAWRATGPGNDCVTGATTGTKAAATGHARNAARRLKEIHRNGHVPRPFTIK